MKLTRSNRLWMGLLLLAALMGTGCPPVPPEPFTEFANSGIAPRDGADEALRRTAESAGERFLSETMTQLEAGKPTGLQALMLAPSPGDTLAATFGDDPPYFLKARGFRKAVFGLNDTLAGYGTLLHELATVGELSATEFKDLAGDLNGNLKGALGSAGLTSVDADAIGIFSTAAIELFQQYLRSASRDALQEALSVNQETIEKVAAAGEEAVEIAGLALWQEYQQDSVKLARLLATPPRDEETLQALLDLDAVTLTRLDALRSLRQAYRRLPHAHRELAASVEDPALTLASIRALYEEGRRLQAIAKELGEDDGG